MEGKTSKNAWQRVIGRGGSGSATSLTVLKTFTAAALNFNTNYNGGIIIPAVQGTMILPSGIWVYYNAVTPPIDISDPSDGYHILLRKNATNETVKLGDFRSELFGPTSSETYQYIALNGDDRSLFGRMVSLVDADLIFRPAQNTNPTNHRGGDYTLKFLVQYEQLTVADWQ